jgi:hypothetical protein
MGSEPDRDEALLGIVHSGRVTEERRSVVGRLEARLPGQSPRRAQSIHQALGKALDDLSDFGGAIRHCDEAHRIALEELRRSGDSYDRSQHEADVDRLLSSFTREFFEAHAGEGSDSERPVFIVGMPRSGTTLVEQILSRHSQVAAGGELNFWFGQEPDFTADSMIRCSPEMAALLGDRYLSVLETIDPKSLRVTDKLPDNYLRIGLIQWVFPNARFIHCRRDPIDTCLSIYVTPFRNPLNYAHDRRDLVHVYRQYERAMSHWRDIVPKENLLEVQYERLVAEPEKVTRELVRFCGLDWEDGCLDQRAASKLVDTPSMWQVRQPIYSSSVARWRNYEPWLGALADLKQDRLT